MPVDLLDVGLSIQSAQGMQKQSRSIPGDRVQMALHHAIKGDLDLSLQSLYDPSSLAPHQMVEFAEADLGVLERDVGERGVLHALKRIGTDPAFWLGMALSAIFPVAGNRAQLKRYFERGTVYNKQIGLLRQLTSSGSSLFTDSAGRPTKASHALETVAQLMDTETRRHYPVFSSAMGAYSKVSGRRTVPKESLVRIAAKLDRLDDANHETWKWLELRTGRRLGLKPIRLTPEEQIIFSAFDHVRKTTYKDVISKLNPQQLRQWDASLVGRGIVAGKKAEKIDPDKYFPHYLEIKPKKIKDAVVDLLRQGRVDEAIALSNPLAPRHAVSWEEYIAMGTRQPIPKSLRPRYNRLLPSPDDLKALGGLVKPGTIETLNKLSGDVVKVAGKDILVGTYTMDPTRVFGEYVNSVARFKAYTMSGYGRVLRRELGRMQHQNPSAAHLLETIYIPAARGVMNPHEYMRAVNWETSKIHWVDRLQSNKMWQSKPLKPVADWITDSLLTSRGWYKDVLPGSLSSYLYLSTLGLNLSSSFANLMQTFSTTMPLLGFRNTAHGIHQAISRVGKYSNFRLKGVEEGAAFSRSFKEFVEAGLDRREWHGEAFRRTLDEAFGKATAATTKSGQKVSSWIVHKMMLPFTKVEEFNRLTAFYGATKAAESFGIQGSRAIQFGRRVVAETQFISGPLGTSPVLSKLPRSLRMFARYPLGLLGFYSDQIRQGNVGVVGRAIAGARMLQEAGGEAGLDISHGLAWSGLPLPTEGGGFPIIPPVVRMGSALASAAMEGDTEELRKVLPLLVPGGIAISRFAAGFNPKLAKFIGKNYVDYEHPSPDGRYLQFTPEGTPIGYFSKTQLVMQGLGFKVGDIAAEQEGAKYLKKMGEHIHQLRVQFQEGMVTNDSRSVSSALQQWKQMFPTSPFPVKASDIRAVQDRRTLLRAELLMRQIPVEARGEFAGAMSFAVADRLPSLFGKRPVSPMGMEAGDRLRPMLGMDASQMFPEE